MNAVNLEKSLESIKKCYIGKNDDGQYVLDKSKIDGLTWIFTIHRVTEAIKNKEITEEQFINKLEGKDE